MVFRSVPLLAILLSALPESANAGELCDALLKEAEVRRESPAVYVDKKNHQVVIEGSQGSCRETVKDWDA